jgi:hypothetical protein
MDKERIKELAENPEFIPGIYNYCDRWCERCPLTSRCMNFALSEEQFSEPDARDMGNKFFWQRLSEAFRLTRELLEDALEKQEIEVDGLHLETAREEERVKQETADSHECSRSAKAYGALVERWFDATEQLFEEKRNDLKMQIQRDFPSIEILKKAASFENTIEIVRWYQHQIYVKIMRAISSKMDEHVMMLDGDLPKDSDGSAKVALIGIDRSIVAWLALRQYLPEHKDNIIDVLVHLDRLRKNIEKFFPNARAFVRPGFDEVL